MSKNKLSIYLIKEGLTKEEIFDEENEIQELEIHSENKISYYIPSFVHQPNWLMSFFNMRREDLKQANSRVVLLNKLNIDGEERIFAIVFGYAKNLFAEDVLEEQFGLKIVLNTIGVNDIRKLTKTSVGSNHKHSQEQMPKATNINEFGFDLDRDLIRNVTAKCNDEVFEKANLTGGDIFSILVERDIDNIDEFLIECFRRYKDNKYKENFEWIDNIKEVKSKYEKQKLDEEVINYINNNRLDCVWMSIPEVISWENIRGFKYANEDEIYDDIFIEVFIESLRNELNNIEQIKRRKVSMIDINENELAKWSAYKCLNAEIKLNDKSYCLNNGKWYYINNDFVQKIEQEYSNIEISEIDFINYTSQMEDEDDYNEALQNSLDNSYLIHKIGEIPYGGGTGNKIEVCDVMTSNKQLIHIKKNGGSSYLSHLFNQASVSAELLLELGFREKVNTKMQQQNFDIEFPSDFKANEYTIVIGIINRYEEERPKIPFFSKVALRYTLQRMKNLGYNVKLKNIKKE